MLQKTLHVSVAGFTVALRQPQCSKTSSIILSLFFGDFMDRKANPRLYDEIQDTESLSVVSTFSYNRAIF